METDPRGKGGVPPRARVRTRRSHSIEEEAIRKITVNLLGVAVLTAAGVALLRQGPARSEPVEAKTEEIPPGETMPGKIRLEKLRALGF